ncbi:MAG: glycosyltransferase family 4 protein [Anaerolineae bacterium]|nr:MAG: glycosyltransferase family 4 protein [Anaerolineae bacterium]
MKICLAMPNAGGGGSSTFLRNFQEYLIRENIDHTTALDEDYDVLFVNSWTIPYRTILQHKKRLSRLRVIHRIDGSARDYGRYDGADWLQRDVNYLADVTIFQSDYSRHSTQKKYHIVHQDGPIIYNPVDTEHYKPRGDSLPHGDKKRVISAVWSPNPRKGAWRLPALAQANPDIEFVFIGNAKFNKIPSNLRQMNAVNHVELAKVLRSGDVFINLSENDPCPNIVLEAMACGLPVIFLPSGGVPELVGDAGLPFAPEGNFRATLNQLLENQANYAEKARQRTLTVFHPNVIFPQYLEAIENGIRRPLPPAMTHFQAFLDAQNFAFQTFLLKWRRILAGQQPLRNPNKKRS